MIQDAELIFFDEQTLSSATLTSNNVFTGVGEANDNMTIVCDLVAPTPSTGGCEVEIITGSSTSYSDAVTLATIEAPFRVKIPRGNLGWIKLKATCTYTGGKMNASLVYDDDVL